MRLPRIITILLVAVSLATSVGKAAAQEIERSWQERLTTHISETYKISNAKTIVDAVLMMSHAYEIEPSLLFAIIHVESRFQSRAKNSSGATGLTQVMLPLHKSKFDKNSSVYDPEENIRVGAEIWKECELKSKTFNQAARCYSGDSTSWARKVSSQQIKFKQELL